MMVHLGRYDFVPPTNGEFLEASDALIERYKNDYHLLFQRGLAFVRLQQLAEAHTAFKRAFEISPCFEATDWLAITSQLTGQNKDTAIANARLAELIADGQSDHVWRKRDLVLAYCCNPENRDCSAALNLIETAAEENQNSSILLARSIARLRSGNETRIRPIRSDETPRITILSICFAAIAQAQSGEPDEAQALLAEARDFAKKMLASPDGTDFSHSPRARAWAISGLVLQEAERAVAESTADAPSKEGGNTQ
jgi:tetratricopeptide (TPR) repeat protein